METSRSSSNYPTRTKRSYWLENTSVIHKASNKTSASLFLATHTLDQKSPAIDSLFEVRITIDTDHIADLRQVASETCGRQMDSFLIEPTKKPSQKLIRLRCVGKAVITQLMVAVIAKLESAEFGRVCRV
ncbi:hypothetical protein [Cellvibrio mixtus]|uniref:hypothetical protein n=1 Tax=Cellvibrio mixtus TaxID=39650 RepID=UPI000587ACE4|nr:hypothetical protein [Cellvibrio mixtus]